MRLTLILFTLLFFPLRSYGKVDPNIDFTNIVCNGKHHELFFLHGENHIRLKSMTEFLLTLDGKSPLEKFYSFIPQSDVFVRRDGQMLMISYQRQDPSTLRLIKFEISSGLGMTLLTETADHAVAVDVTQRSLKTDNFTCTW